MTTPRNAPASPLPWVLAYVFLASFGTGIVTNGIYFLTSRAYAYGDQANFALGLAIGLTYILGAAGVGPALRRLVALWPRLSTRGALLAVTLLVALACEIPIAARTILGQTPPPAVVWLMVLVYIPLTGALWPIAESYVTGGRGGAALRVAAGRFNWTWASAVALAFLLMAPMLAEQRAGGPADGPISILAFLGLVHALTALLLLRFHPEPGAHAADAHEPHPAVYRRLLVVHRFLLPASYIVMSAVTPHLPEVMRALGSAEAWGTAMASVWLVVRIAVFFLLERWHGWHGRWEGPIVGMLAMLAGAAGVYLFPVAGATVALVGTLVSLAVFGSGLAVLYTGAFYYAMEVGAARIDAGGTHESLIGIGYTAGPLFGVLAVANEHAGIVPLPAEAAVLLMVGLSIGVMILLALRSARRGSPKDSAVRKGTTPAPGQ